MSAVQPREHCLFAGKNLVYVPERDQFYRFRPEDRTFEPITRAEFEALNG